MQQTSETWSRLMQDPNAKRIYTFVIEGIEYGEDEYIKHSVDNSLFDEFSIGNATSATLDLEFSPKSEVEIPRGAKISRFVQLKTDTEESEKLPKGTFWISRRQNDGYVQKFQCYDAMRKADNYWEPEETDTFPMSQKQAVSRIAEIMGIEVDPRNLINPVYTIDYPGTNTTMRDILGWIAAANGGNFIISDDGKLRLVRISDSMNIISALVDEDGAVFGWGDENTIIGLDEPSEESDGEETVIHNVGQDIITGQSNGVYVPVTRVTLTADGQQFTAGEDYGAELAGECLYAAQYIVDDLLSSLSGIEYNMYEATAVNIDLAYELGDGIEVDGISSIIATSQDDGSGYVDLSAPGRVETTEEYPAVDSSSAVRATNRKLASTQAAIERSIDEVRLYVENEAKAIRSEISVLQDEIRQEITDTANNASSLIDQKLGSIKLSVGATQTDGTRSYADVTLDIDGTTQRGRVNILGDTNIDGVLVANALYAVSARFNDVSSSMINTSDKIQRYLSKNTSDFTYLVADGDGLRLYYAQYVGGGVVQSRDKYGRNLYWLKNTHEASIRDGWPYDKDGSRIYTTTTPNAYAVWEYPYKDTLIFSSEIRHMGEDGYGASLQLNTIQTRGVFDQNPFVVERKVDGAELRLQSAHVDKEARIKLDSGLGSITVNGELFPT